MLYGLGYDATRKDLDSFIRHAHMELPAEEGGRPAWGIENVADYAMQLEKMRSWLPGSHNSKKTVWGLQAESDNVALGARRDRLRRGTCRG